MTLPQILLLLAIIVLTVLLTIIGVQVIYLLRDSRVTLKKIDNIVDNFDYLTTSLVRTSSTFSHLSTSLQSGMQLVGLVSKLINNSKKNK